MQLNVINIVKCEKKIKYVKREEQGNGAKGLRFFTPLKIWPFWGNISNIWCEHSVWTC